MLKETTLPKSFLEGIEQDLQRYFVGEKIII